MSKISRTIAFIMILAGLLGWAITSMAHGPSMSAMGTAIELHGRVSENGTPISRDQIHLVNR